MTRVNGNHQITHASTRRLARRGRRTLDRLFGHHPRRFFHLFRRHRHAQGLVREIEHQLESLAFRIRHQQGTGRGRLLQVQHQAQIGTVLDAAAQALDDAAFGPFEFDATGECGPAKIDDHAMRMTEREDLVIGRRAEIQDQARTALIQACSRILDGRPDPCINGLRQPQKRRAPAKQGEQETATGIDING